MEACMPGCFMLWWNESVFTLFLSKSLKALGAWIMKWCLNRKMCHWRGHFAFLGTPCWLQPREEKLCAVAKDTAAGRKQSFSLFCSFWHLVDFFFSMLSGSVNIITIWKLKSFILEFWQVARAVALLKLVITHAKLRGFEKLKINRKTVETCV